jgi:hypothetical protein
MVLLDRPSIKNFSDAKQENEEKRIVVEIGKVLLNSLQRQLAEDLRSTPKG